MAEKLFEQLSTALRLLQKAKDTLGAARGAGHVAVEALAQGHVKRYSDEVDALQRQLVRFSDAVELTQEKGGAADARGCGSDDDDDDDDDEEVEERGEDDDGEEDDEDESDDGEEEDEDEGDDGEEADEDQDEDDEDTGEEEQVSDDDDPFERAPSERKASAATKHPLAVGTRFATSAALTAALKNVAGISGRGVHRKRGDKGLNGNVAKYACNHPSCRFSLVAKRSKGKAPGADKFFIVHEFIEHDRVCIAPSTTSISVLRKNPDIVAAVLGKPQMSAKELSTLVRTVTPNGGLSSTQASRLKAAIMADQSKDDDLSFNRVGPWGRLLVKENPGAIVDIKLGGLEAGMSESAADVLDARTLSISSRKEADGRVSVQEIDDGTGRLAGLRVMSVVVALPLIADGMDALYPTFSLDYARQLKLHSGGLVILEGRIMNKIIPLAFALTRGETAAAWGEVLDAITRANPGLPTMPLTLITDRFTGADEVVNDALPSWYHLVCARHFLLNCVGRPRGALSDPSLYWAVSNARNEDVLSAALRNLEAKHPEHFEYLMGVPLERWVYTRAAAKGAKMSGARTNNAVEQENARGKATGDRYARGLRALNNIIKQHAAVLAKVRREAIGALEQAKHLETPLIPHVQLKISESLEHKSKFCVLPGNVTKFTPTGAPLAGIVTKLGEDGAMAAIDLEAGQCGSCTRCRLPDGEGLPCVHMLAFFTGVVQPRTKESDAGFLATKTLACYQLRRVVAALERVQPVTVPVIEAVPDEMDSVAPLVGAKPVGRPAKAHKKRGPKGKRDDSKRILSRGEREAKRGRSKKAKLGG